MSEGFTHLDADGAARMVDVGGKVKTRRLAVAACEVRLSPATMALLTTAALPKGDALTTAKIAGIMAAKRTADLIPLCHPLPLAHADVRFVVDEAAAIVRVEAEASTVAETGVEMEALAAAMIAALTIYDMCKAVQKDIVISQAKLLFKSGGKSGTFVSPDWPAGRPYPAS